jgi:hypothetical protein
MQALLSLILSWLVINTGLPAADTIPQVAFVSSAKMAEVRYQRLQPSRPDQADFEAARAKPPDSFEDVYAIYDAPGGTIYLSEGWRADSPVDVSVLVHELVHHLQHAAGLDYACPAAREKLAYQAQERWLNLFETSLVEEFELDAMTLLLRTKCMH